MIEERVAVGLKVEPQGTAHVDVGVSDGGDAREMGRVELFGGFGDNDVDVPGVPEYNQIGDQGEGSGYGRELLGRATVRGGDGTVMDGALQGVNGFALGEQGMNCAPIPFVGQIIAKVDCAYERADRGAGFVYGVALRRAAEAFDQPACTAPAMLQRRSHMQKFVVASRNRGWRNGAPGDLGKCFGHGKATWKVKLTIGNAGRAHAQADAKGFADSCSEVGIAMRVDRETLDAGMPQGPLDRRTGLSGAQQDRFHTR